MHLNARSLNKHYDDLSMFLSNLLDFKFTVIGITETWLRPDSPPIFNLDTYDMNRADRIGGKGGGVAIYVQNQTQYKKRTDIHVDGTEDIFIEIVNKHGKNMIIGVIYRPPNNSIDLFLEKLYECLHKISQENKQIYLMGDYNIDLLSATQNAINSKLVNILSSYTLYPHIDKPTRITTTSSTLIDNMFSNIIDMDFINGIFHYDISDHLPIFTLTKQNNIVHESQKTNHKMYRKETNRNVDSFNLDLAQEQWHDVIQEKNVNKAYDNFIKKLLYYYDKNIPLARQNPHTKVNNPWITKGILNSIRKRNRLYKKSLLHPSENNKKKYKRYRNTLTTLIRLSRKLYYSTKIENNKDNNNSLWQIIKDLIDSKRTNKNKTFNHNEQEVKDPKQISNIFNTYFSNIGPKLASEIKHDEKLGNFKQFLNKPINKSLFLRPTTPHEILEIVRLLKSSKSTGYDGVSVNLLKRIIYYIVEPLTHMFNLSISSGVCPNSLKIAKVIPIYKKDDSALVSNYRPISLLPSISKILEKIVHKRLYNFLNSNNLLIPNQYGFRKSHSTDYALIKLYDKIIHSLSNKEHTFGIFMDLSKAFDTINHEILINKLHNYGIRGTSLSWFKDYLKNRKQYVVYESEKSQELNITCGVPQGSILGPLLFILYINDIVKSSQLLTFIIFADDTNILYSHKDLNTAISTLNNELSRIQLWFKCNKLSLNIKKTNFMYFRNVHSPQIQCNILIDDIPLVEKQSTKFLGIEIDCNLTWNDQINNITKSISRNIGIMSKLKYFISEKSLLTLYNALVLSYLNYCNIVWGSCSQTKINSLLLLQKKAVRICNHSSYLAHTTPIFKNLKILTLNDIHTLHTSIFMYKYTTNLLPPSFSNFFNYNANIHSYPTRHSSDFHLHNPKTLIAHKSIRHHGPDIWNSLPQPLKRMTSLSSFKAATKKSLLSQYI